MIDDVNQAIGKIAFLCHRLVSKKVDIGAILCENWGYFISPAPTYVKSGFISPAMVSTSVRR